VVEVVLPVLRRDAGRQKGCVTGGKESGAARREDIQARNIKIIEVARELLKTRKRTTAINRLAERFDLSSRHIRNILKKNL
jgi:hypothetical protein